MYPEKVPKMVLLNGGHGQLLHAFGQPFFRVPLVGDYLHYIIIKMHQHHRFYDVTRSVILGLLGGFRVFMLKPFCFLMGLEYEMFVINYLSDFFAYGKEHSFNYLQYPHSLDCHSAFHLLPEITQPTLIVTGMLDFITPAYSSYEMSWLMPNAELLCKQFGSHFCLLEYPEEIAAAISEFLYRNTSIEEEVRRVEVEKKGKPIPRKKKGTEEGKGKEKSVSTGRGGSRSRSQVRKSK